MSDLFKEKAQEWDVNQMVQQLSAGIGTAILDNIKFNEEMQVMDFGAGTGLISAHVAPQVKKIKAVDISAAMLEQLASKPELKDKVETVCQNIITEPLDEQFDLIMSAMAMHHVEDTAAMLSSFYQHLSPGARVALADLDKEDGSFHPADVEGVYHQGFERGEMENLLSNSGFTDINFVTAHTVNKEGKEYPVFLVTAVKS